MLTQKDPAVYKGIAKFFTYLSSPEVQADWHQATGYVPITIAAYELTKSQGFYEKNPGFDIAIGELNNKPPTANSKGVRLGNFVEIRNINDEELEQVWNGQKTAKQALDEAVKPRQRAARAVPEGQPVDAAAVAPSPVRRARRRLGMDDRAVFRSRWLPYALVAPQIAITLVFFFWPAAQALYQSVLVQDVFGTRTRVRLVRQFQDCSATTRSISRSFRVTAVFSLLVAVDRARDRAAPCGLRRPHRARAPPSTRRC